MNGALKIVQSAAMQVAVTRFTIAREALGVSASGEEAFRE